VALGELFGFAEGTIRTALSRMTSSGELVADNGRYRLGERLRRRQASQDAGRRSPPGGWDGTWWIAHVVADGRTVGDRRAFRSRMLQSRMGELRPDVWLRPANIDGPDAGDDVLLTRGSIEDRDPVALAGALWDLDAMQSRGRTLTAAATNAKASLATRDPALLPETFMISVAVVRFLLAEPQLPVELVGPGWPADRLRHSYDELEAAHGALMTSFLASAAAGLHYNS
jgi:phenylacetic acid degradation operon negative regulatory protein